MAGHCRGLTSQVKVNGSGCRLRGMGVKNNWICLKMVRPFFPLNGLFGAKKRHAILRQIYYISWTIIRKMVLGHILASQRGYPCRMPMVLSKMVPTRMTVMMMMMWLLLQIPRLSPPELQQLQFRHLCPRSSSCFERSAAGCPAWEFRGYCKCCPSRNWCNNVTSSHAEQTNIGEPQFLVDISKCFLCTSTFITTFFFQWNMRQCMFGS